MFEASRTLVSEPLVGARMSGDLEDWGEEDEEDLLAVAEAGEQVKKEEEKEEDDPFADGEDDLLMQSLLEVDEDEGKLEVQLEKVETKVETKAKADEDSFEALKLEPPTAQQNYFLTSNFGHRLSLIHI